MGDDEITPSLEAAYAVETPDENRRLYAEWASSYEETFVAAKAYRYHLHVADTLVAHVRPAGPTLDVGCGTGVVGVALRERGVSEIDGVDISPDMIDKAREKGDYRKLMQADLTADYSHVPTNYAAIVSSGTFTFGHLGPELIPGMVGLCRSGAVAALGVNSTYFAEQGFRSVLDSLEEEGQIGNVSLHEMPIYDGRDAAHKDDTAMILAFTTL